MKILIAGKIGYFERINVNIPQHQKIQINLKYYKKRLKKIKINNKSD